MNAQALRPCPFCANDKPVVPAVGHEWVEIIAVVCPECGAAGPRARPEDPAGHPIFLWNQRFGVNH